MPRARTETTAEQENDVPKKRAPRKRVVSTDGEISGGQKPRSPRKRTPARVLDTVETPTISRRAPTPIRTERIARSRSRRGLIVAGLAFFLLTGVGAAIGMSDQGQIDVVAVTNERNERINRGEVREGESTITVPVQNTDIRPNGGLVPADPDVISPPVMEAASTIESMATSTEDGTASSSPETVDETMPTAEGVATDESVTS